MHQGWTILLCGMAMGCLCGGSVGADAPVTMRAGENVATQSATQYWFGVAVEKLPPAIAKQLRLKPDQGLMVDAIMHDSPAARAGLKPDDILIELNGTPLTSQIELAIAANTLVKAADGMTPQESKLAYRREGEQLTTTLTPALRPTDMLVSGKDLENFSASVRIAALAPPGTKSINYVLPDGGTGQVGPGYRLNLSGTGFTARSVREVVSKGKTIVLSQETDAIGVTHNTIIVGHNVYPVEAGRLDALPEDLRPLAEQLLSPSNGAATQGSAAIEVTDQQRVEQLEKEKSDLQKKLDDANEKLEKIHGAK